MLHHVRRYFLTTVSREAMHEQHILIGHREQPGIDLIATERPFTVFLLVFLAHGSPDVGHQELGVSGRLGRLPEHLDPVFVALEH